MPAHPSPCYNRRWSADGLKDRPQRGAETIRELTLIPISQDSARLQGYLVPIVPRAHARGSLCPMHDFKVGDLVQLAEVAARSARYPARLGAVVGFARHVTRVKVLWSSLDRPQVIHAALLKFADQYHPETAGMTASIAVRPRSKDQPRILEWSPHEDEHLRRLLSNGKGAAHAAKVLSRSEKAVRARARKLGVPSRRIPAAASAIERGQQERTIEDKLPLRAMDTSTEICPVCLKMTDGSSPKTD